MPCTGPAFWLVYKAPTRYIAHLANGDRLGVFMHVNWVEMREISCSASMRLGERQFSPLEVHVMLVYVRVVHLVVLSYCRTAVFS